MIFKNLNKNKILKPQGYDDFKLKLFNNIKKLISFILKIQYFSYFFLFPYTYVH